MNTRLQTLINRFEKLSEILYAHSGEIFSVDIAEELTIACRKICRIMLTNSLDKFLKKFIGKRITPDSFDAVLWFIIGNSKDWADVSRPSNWYPNYPPYISFGRIVKVANDNTSGAHIKILFKVLCGPLAGRNIWSLPVRWKCLKLMAEKWFGFVVSKEYDSNFVRLSCGYPPKSLKQFYQLYAVISVHTGNDGKPACTLMDNSHVNDKQLLKLLQQCKQRNRYILFGRARKLGYCLLKKKVLCHKCTYGIDKCCFAVRSRSLIKGKCDICNSFGWLVDQKYRFVCLSCINRAKYNKEEESDQVMKEALEKTIFEGAKTHGT